MYIKLPYGLRLVHQCSVEAAILHLPVELKKLFFFLVSQDVSKFDSLFSVTFACSLLFSPRLMLISKQQCKQEGHSCLTSHSTISGGVLTKKSPPYSILLLHSSLALQSRQSSKQFHTEIRREKFCFLNLFCPVLPREEGQDSYEEGWAGDIRKLSINMLQ